MEKKITALIILDGFGVAPFSESNAISPDTAKNILGLCKEYANTTIIASGEEVGLPKGLMGNSEVGHLNIGAGRIVVQDIDRINKSIISGEFYKLKPFVDAMENCLKKGTNLHIMGMLSDGGVHSHNSHLYELLKMAKQYGLKNVYIHCFLDGRDTGKTSGRGYIAELEQKIKEIGVGAIATVMGRFYAMDRDKNYDRNAIAYSAMFDGGVQIYDTADAAVAASYENGLTDEVMKPAAIKGMPTISDGDSIIFYNYRPDRAIQIMQAVTYTDDEIAPLMKRSHQKDVYVATMLQYSNLVDDKIHYAFEKIHVQNTLGEWLSKNGKSQYHVAETEKHKHVTSYFNGSIEQLHDKEEWKCIKSPGVSNFKDKPEMAADIVADTCIEGINSNKYDFLVVNFANPDMVGHTGDLEAAKIAVRTVDKQAKRVVDAVLAAGGKCIIIADHGNCDEMIDLKTGEVSTKHSTNPVPFILVDPDNKNAKLRTDGALRDVAPTILDLMGIDKPAEMTGNTMIIK